MKLLPLLEADVHWSQKMRIAEEPGRLRSFAAVIAHSGDSWFWLLGLALVWAYGGPTWRTWAWRLILPTFCLALIVLVVKFLVRRPRPEGDWGAVYRSTDPHSFPSGHAARATLLAVLVLGFGPPWLAVVLVIWAPFVALARVSMGVHYLSDVVVGALIGALSGVAALLVMA